MLQAPGLPLPSEQLIPCIGQWQVPSLGLPRAEGSVTGKALKATHPVLLEVCQNHITWCGAGTGVLEPRGQLSSLACSLCQLQDKAIVK